jgi:FtsH-binding integral membrane protein
MIYLLSWHGRGFVAFLAIWVAVASMLFGLPFNEDAAFLTFTIGWLVVGIVCFILGRKWNANGNVHRFCGAPLQVWGVIYCCIGLLLVMPAYQNLVQMHPRPRSRPAPRAGQSLVAPAVVTVVGRV